MLHAIARAVLVAAGSDEREASIVADHLVEANLRGHDSHGVGMLPTYVRNRRRGGTRANRRPSVVRDDGPFLVIDGDRGFGHVVAREATDLAIARARQPGRRGAGGPQRVPHGSDRHLRGAVRGGGPGVRPLRQRHRPRALGGAARREGGAILHQPVLHRVPGDGRNPAVILDVATSRMSWGKIRVWRHEGLGRCRMASCWMTLDGRPAIPR